MSLSFLKCPCPKGIMKTQTNSTRHPRILTAMTLALAISVAPALAEADKPQPPAAEEKAALAAKKNGGPHVVMIVNLRGRDGFHYSGYRGENFWFNIQEVPRYLNPRPEDNRWELFFQAMQEQAKDLEGNHQIKLELHAFDDRIQRVEKAIKGHDKLIFAYTPSDFAFASLMAKHDWGFVNYEDLCILPFTKENMTNIDELYMEWRKKNPFLNREPINAEDIKKAVTQPIGH